MSGATAAVKLGVAERRWPRSECGRHGRRRCSDRAADGWVPRGFQIFIICPKTGSNSKIEMDILSCFKNSQFLHAASRQCSKELAKLCRLQIPNRNKVKNPVTDSVFESLTNFKRDSNIREKSDKFSKIPS
jgi:hypothetical protein